MIEQEGGSEQRGNRGPTLDQGKQQSRGHRDGELLGHWEGTPAKGASSKVTLLEVLGVQKSWLVSKKVRESWTAPGITITPKYSVHGA